jgi:FlgN protein
MIALAGSCRWKDYGQEAVPLSAAPLLVSSGAMTNTELYRSLENYLETALEVLTNWGDWLAEHERRLLDRDVSSLESHAASSHDLHRELSELSERRVQVLADACKTGVLCSTLKQLAQALPEWKTQADFRQRVKNVERCMASLRRLNTAAWLLVNQCSRVVDDTLLLLTNGSTLQSVYIDVPHADTSGGQILDTQI